MSKRKLGRMLSLVFVLGIIYGGLNLAGAAPPASKSDVTVDNTITNPVPVQQQGTASVTVANTTLPVHEQGTASVNVSNSSLPVHEQGTANVNVTNSSPLPVSMAQPGPINSGGGDLFLDYNTTASPGSVAASALSIHMSAGVSWVALYTNGGGTAAQFYGPSDGGNGDIQLALSRSISFDTVECFGGSSGDTCTVSWVGDNP